MALWPEFLITFYALFSEQSYSGVGNVNAKLKTDTSAANLSKA